MSQPLMPKATAVWLVDKTMLTFEQVATFCNLHKLEVQAIADGEVAVGILGLDPVHNGQLTWDEIHRCEADSTAHLKMIRQDLPEVGARTKGARYTPVAKRGDKPDAIAWLLKNYPDLQDSQIARLVGTTKEMITKVRDRTHWNAANIKPNNPVLLGLCKQADLEAALKRAQRRVMREQAAMATDAEDGDLVLSSTEETTEEGFLDILPVSQEEEQPDIDHDAMVRSLG